MYRNTHWKIFVTLLIKINHTKELTKIKKAVNFAHAIGLEVHAGHGITYRSAEILAKLKNITEFNIGHFIIGESIFVGLCA